MISRDGGYLRLPVPVARRKPPSSTQMTNMYFHRRNKYNNIARKMAACIFHRRRCWTRNKYLSSPRNNTVKIQHQQSAHKRGDIRGGNSVSAISCDVYTHKHTHIPLFSAKLREARTRSLRGRARKMLKRRIDCSARPCQKSGGSRS